MTFKRILTWLGIIGSVASLISLIYFFIPTNKTLNIEVRTISLENLTNTGNKSEPELQIIYKYKNQDIQNLWKYSIIMTNASNKTLIGVGPQRNILADYLTLNLKKGFIVLDKKLIHSDFNNRIITLDSTKIGLAFEQWRSNESVEYTFYIKSDQKIPDKLPFAEPSIRQIIDGDILFKYLNPNDQTKMVTRVLPYQVLRMAYSMSFIILFFIITLFAGVVLLFPLSFYRTKNWHKNHFNNFTTFIKEKFQANVATQKIYLDNPKSLPINIWKEFKGEKFPYTPVDFDIKKFYQFVLLETLLTLICISLIIIFIDLVYMFP